jgi:hypothetical protein
VLLLQHPVLVLVFKQKLCCQVVGETHQFFFFFPVFQQQLFSQLLPQWGVAVWVCILSSGSRKQLCRPPAFLLWSWIFAVLTYWELFPLSCPLSLGQGQRSVSQIPDVSVLCWFADYFSVLQFHLTLDVAHWLRTHLCGLLSALFQAVAYYLPSVSPSAFPVLVYWNFLQRSAPCTSPLLQCAYSTPPPLLHVPFQFLIIQFLVFFFLCGAGAQSVQGPC